jgi:hypothetical protein
MCEIDCWRRSTWHTESNSGIERVNIEFFTGRKNIKQRRISFVLGYLRMILWKISTAISIHWRILYENDTKRRIQLCVKIKKRCYTDLLHFSTRNLAFFFGRIIFSYEYARVNIEFFTGRKNIKQRRISFVLGYLRMILWKISCLVMDQCTFVNRH